MYNFSIGKKAGAKDPYSYNVDDEDDGEVPSYMAKAKKTGGIGGLGLSKKNSLGGGGSKFGASGGSFYGGGKQKEDPYSYGDEYDYGNDDEYGYGKEDKDKGGDEYDYDYDFEDQPQGFSSAFGQSAAQQQKTSQAAGSQKGKKDLVPKRFALSYSPPVIILEYLIPATGKLYHHKMKLLKLKPETPSQDALDYIKKKHFQYFIGDKIDDEQIINLVDKLKQRLQLLQGGSVSKKEEMNNFINKKKEIVSQVTKKAAAYDYDEELGDDDYYGDDYYYD